MPRHRVLVIDDDATLRRVLARELADLGFDVEADGDARDVETRLRDTQPDVVLLDLRLPEIDGHQALARIRAADGELPVVMLTGHGDVTDAVKAMQAGAYDFLQKPVRTGVLEQSLRRAVAHRNLGLENSRLRRAAEAGVDPGLVGDSLGMKKLRGQIERVAAADSHVLVCGENGSGKELIARALHALSPLRDRAFVVVNCGAIPDHLVHSELFGHTKGSFTGADRARVGLFEAADGGTIFLDEIGDLPLDLQPALLRAVQFGEIRPVGSDTTRHVHARVIAATNRDLHAAIAKGTFREDLYYRLATLEIRVPPLRERSGDIELLAGEFLRRCGRRQQRSFTLTPEAIARLRSHSWPGNVRELENAVTRLTTMADGDTIDADLVDALVLGPARSGGGDLPTLDVHELERLAIAAAMQRFAGDKKRAAEALGISLKTLYNKLAGETR